MDALRFLPVTALLLAACGQAPTPDAASSALDQASLNALAVRPSNKQIAAHAGDGAARPYGWDENEWENSIQALTKAKAQGVRWIEVDLQLNRHPSAVSANSYGILYMHHNRYCKVIDSSGRVTGPTIDIATADPAQVDRCAERLENVLNSVGYTGHWMFEMKDDTGYTVDLPKALNALLKKRGQRTTEVITSLNENMLITVRDAAAYDQVKLNLTRVYGATTKPTNADIDRSRGLGFRYVSANVNDWDQSVVDYAKERQLYTMGWHWELTSPRDGNTRGVNLGVDVMITDDADLTQGRQYQGCQPGCGRHDHR
ncbi:glycerophosphodiester phosphodiesterase [Deinococcus frigens]|uniref:glycerophosphodiester phosphodiesterase n=1 Tax=Deinococcus frigens TaxID=249403 RepID=UPI0004957C29|nr:glycerophosphodiester phosphodiesterase [Deinococcus frigens]